MTRSKDNKEYMKKYMLQRYHERHDIAVKKLGGKCVICGSTENLEFDHIDPKTKTMSINKMWGISEERYLKELSLCQLLCKKHHREKTSKENSVDHGEGLTGKRNCRCDLCRPLKNAYTKELKRKKREERKND